MSGEIDKLFLNSVPESPASADASTFHGKIVVAAVPVPAGSKAAPIPSLTVTKSSSDLRDVKSGNSQATSGKGK